MLKLVSVVAILLLVQAVFAFGPACPTRPHVESDLKVEFAPPANLKVALFGDGGIKTSSKEVLNLIKSEGADFTIHLGDFDYENNPQEWMNQIDSILGPDYPYFATIGNHDNLRWETYQQLLLERLARYNASCIGDYGVQATCTYQGMVFILSGVGTRRGAEDHHTYITNQFSRINNIWKICGWHKNQRLYQTGGKINEVGYEVYDACREQGAIVATGHEHSYARTHLMSDFENFVIDSTSNTLNLSKGKSFCFVSGLGGQSIRSWDNNLEKNPWWAATAASDVGVSDGVLFCTFNINNDPRQASCYFKDRLGKIWDSFNVHSDLEGADFARAHLPKSSRLQEFSVEQDFYLQHQRKPVDGELLYLGESYETILRFRVPNSVLQNVEALHLQLYAADDSGELPILYIRGITSIKTKTTASVTWVDDDEGFVKHTVWVSPDLKALLAEILDINSATDIVELSVTGSGARQVFASNYDPCLSPTLSIQLKKN